MSDEMRIPKPPEAGRFSIRLQRVPRILTAGAVLFVAASSAICWWDPYISDGRYLIDTLKIDAHHDIAITGELEWEVSETVFYELRQDRQPLHHCLRLGGTIQDTANIGFDLLASENRDFVAVVERADPDRVLMFYDFQTGVNWPYEQPLTFSEDCCDTESWHDFYARMNRVLDRLRDSLHRNLVLSHQSHGHRLH
jgi:hypothetical protein